MEDRDSSGRRRKLLDPDSRTGYQLIVLLAAAVIFLGCIVSPPSLMDDVDAVQAQIARNMLKSGDWVTARLDQTPRVVSGGAQHRGAQGLCWFHGFIGFEKIRFKTPGSGKSAARLRHQGLVARL